MSIDPKRRFPPPWTVRELGACYVVEDTNGIPIAYVYFDTNVMRSASSYHHLTWDEARRFARAIARLPELLTGTNARAPQSQTSSIVRPNERETD